MWMPFHSDGKMDKAKFNAGQLYLGAGLISSCHSHSLTLCCFTFLGLLFIYVRLGHWITNFSFKIFNSNDLLKQKLQHILSFTGIFLQLTVNNNRLIGLMHITPIVYTLFPCRGAISISASTHLPR